MPDSERLTRSTWSAWSSMERFRWMTPRPPWRAIAIAMRDSVTVSIAADKSGVWTVMRLEIRDDVSASEGMTFVCPGRSRTSSYVRPTKPKGSCSGWVMSAPLTLVLGVALVGVAADDQPVITGLACALVGAGLVVSEGPRRGMNK